MADRTIRDLLEVRPRPTVVQLAHLERADADWIRASWCATEAVEAQLHALRAALARPSGTGAFLVGQYGAGKSHFLAYVAQALRAGRFGDAPRDVVALSLVHHAAKRPLEEIAAEALGLAFRGDRREAMASLEGRHPRGLVLLVDELSEFLRAKPDARAFTEDVRFLQFLGEWAQEHRFWIVAGMQEQIEHVGELDRALYRKIKDRYPLRLMLSPAHVRELVEQGLFERRAGFGEAAQELAREVLAALPDSSAARRFAPDELAALYPVHPATLDLLEEVRDRFSQARGVIDFVVTRLAGSAERGVEPFLDRPFGEWLTPDLIVDHFRDLFELQAEFVPIAQLVLAHYERHLGALFEKPRQRELAERVLKLLVLAHVSPSRARLHPEEAASWLFVRASRIDVEKNVAVVTRVLETLAREGRYVVADGAGFRLDLGETDAARLERELERTALELEALGEAVFDELAPLLRGRRFDPFVLPRDEVEQRAFSWHFHERRFALHLGEGAPPHFAGPALAIRLPWGDAAPLLGWRTLVPARIEVAPRHRELAALVRLSQRSWSEASAKKLAERIERGAALFEEEVRSAFQNARAVDAKGGERPAHASEPRSGFERWLALQAEDELRARFPSFERFAPLHGPLSRDALERFARAALQGELCSETNDEAVALVREGYLVPMRLLARRGRGYEVPKGAARHELVQLVLPLAEQAPSARAIAERLAQPVYGLVPDQVRALLLFLAAQGELELSAGGQPYREQLDMRPDPLACERVEPGRALAPAAQRALRELAAELGVDAPDAMTALAARRAIAELGARGRKLADELAPLALELASTSGAGALSERVSNALGPWRELEGERGAELEAFERFLQRAGPIPRFVDELRTVRALPGRIQRLLEGLRRHAHLFEQPELARSEDAGFRERVEALGAPPAIERVQDAEAWLARAASLYREHAEGYRGRHDAWWSERREHPIWRWSAPPLARSRRAGVDEALAASERARARALELRCGGVGDLSYRTVCACGFGAREEGREGIELALARFDEAREGLDAELVRFFAREDVRERVREWVELGLGTDERTLAYLHGREALPGIEDVERFDRHLVGLELVRRVRLDELAPALCGKSFERDEAVAAFADALERLGSGRLRFEIEVERERESRVARWCLEQALRHGVELPEGLRGLEEACEPLAPGAIGERARARIDALGLPRAVEALALVWMVEGTLDPPRAGELTPLVEAIRAMRSDAPPRAAGARSEALARAWSAHARLAAIGSERWGHWLERLAGEELAPPPPPLADALRARSEAQWLVVDALSAPLVAALRERLDALFAPWRIERIEHALAPVQTTTDAFYRELAGAGLARRLEKLDGIDRLVHEREEAFDDLARLAAAELEIGWRRVVERFDAGRPLVVLADHGFRPKRAGRGYSHGGPSIAERLVPLLSLRPA